MPLSFQNTLPLRASTASSRSHIISKDVANAPKKEPIEVKEESQERSDEDDKISRRLMELQEELFTSLKEDISDWIIKTLGETDINAENFIYALDNGVILCRLSLAIDKMAKKCLQEGLLSEPLPDYKLHCNKSAKSGTWFARDNTTNFLKWCRAYGMTDETLFDSEDLVAHHQERQVIYCLMDLARLGTRFGLEPPSLISLEREIDSDLTPPCTPPTAATPGSPSHPTAAAAASQAQVENPSKETSPSSTALQQPQTTPAKKDTVPLKTLDSEVNLVSQKCKCQDYVHKISEGLYNVFGKRVYIRLLKGKHLMVRVGGGWDTFENYLLHHDPIQVFEFHTNSHDGPVRTTTYNKDNFNPDAYESYLVIRSKYKSNSFCS